VSGENPCKVKYSVTYDGHDWITASLKSNLKEKKSLQDKMSPEFHEIKNTQKKNTPT
jgi:hypothetical protein